MNTGILQRCIDELNKEDFRKDYVLGMLETLVEIDIPHTAGSGVSSTIAAPGTIVKTEDEGTILDARARIAIEAVKQIAEESNVE